MTMDLPPNDAEKFITANELKQAVRSFCPGRLRLRHEVLRGVDPETIDFVRQCLCLEYQALDVEINPRVGSMLLVWDPVAVKLNFESLAQQAAGMLETARSMGWLVEKQGRLLKKCDEKTLKCLTEGLSQATDVSLGLLARVIAPDVNKGGRAKRVAQNRLMLGALMLSIVSLFGAGARAHMILGTAFTALLGIHLWQHRKVL